jgi:monovalent cation/hydrogen antiporter
MRGIVTLAAAMGLPSGFPYRDFIQLTAFVVVVGTLLIQGLTLRPLLALLRLPTDRVLDSEVSIARSSALKAAIDALDRDDSPAAQRLKQEYTEALHLAASGQAPHHSPDNDLRRQVVAAARAKIDELRTTGKIGDDAYRQVEEETRLAGVSVPVRALRAATEEAWVWKIWASFAPARQP